MNKLSIHENSISTNIISPALYSHFLYASPTWRERRTISIKIGEMIRSGHPCNNYFQCAYRMIRIMPTTFSMYHHPPERNRTSLISISRLEWWLGHWIPMKHSFYNVYKHIYMSYTSPSHTKVTEQEQEQEQERCLSQDWSDDCISLSYHYEQ